MKLRTRVALWSLLCAALASAALTGLFVVDASRARNERLRAEGGRVAFSAITLYDVLRLTGSAADQATLQAFMNAAVRGNESEREIAWAVVVDEKGALVAGAVNERVLTGKSAADVVAHLEQTPADTLIVDAAVVARDSAAKALDTKAGRVVVALSKKPAREALARTTVIGGGVSALIALALAGVLGVLVNRRAVRPIRAVVEGMSAVRGGALDTVIPDRTSADEAALLVDGFNDMVAALADRDKLKTTLSRHVGKKLASELSAGQVGAGRRVRVTALSLDVDGFTQRVSRDAPEEVVSFVQEVVAACIAVIEEHEGHVANVLGDSLLALWGVPNESPDDAARAVAAALALQQKCKAISEARVDRRDEGFSVTLGVATGDAVLATVGNDERAESVVVGEPTTLARRIEEQAKATNFGLLVSEETWRALPDDKRYEGAATPLVLIRGWGVPLTLYRVRERRRT